MAALLPKDHDDFRSKQYWETFFQQRSSAFEWYGEWVDLKACVLQSVAARASAAELASSKDVPVLNIGCGNSALSADMYDDGVQSITNIDFSEAVIGSMKRKNTKRTQMKWLEMDMLKTSFSDASFEVIVDKGALDALAAEDTPSVQADTKQLFAEVTRLLRPGGVYICVSLLQDHILQWLVEGTAGFTGLLTPFHPIDSVSPLCPFIGIFRKPVAGGAAPAAGLFTVTPLPAPTMGGGAPAELKAVLAGDTSSTGQHSLGDITSTVHEVQYKYKSLGDLASVRPGRIVTFQVPDASNPEATEPRFRVSVVDSTAGGKKCGALLVPIGRERDWILNSDDGRRQLAAQQGYARLVFITLGRGHTYGAMDVVQAELNDTLAPLALQGSARAMAFLAVASSLGKSTEVASIAVDGGAGQLTDERMVVENVWEDEAASAPSSRRMVFSSNPSAVQTECALRVDEGGNTVVDSSQLPFEYHATIVGAMGLARRALVGASTKLAMARRDAPDASLALPDAFRVMVIGLGGGSLPSFLTAHFPFVHCETVDISPAVVQVAREHFGFVPSANNVCTIGDGVQRIKQGAAAVLASSGSSAPAAGGAGTGGDAHVFSGVDAVPAGLLASKKHAIVYDVDSKDLSFGVSFPPVAFLSNPVLGAVAAQLEEGGVLVVNIASRNPKGFHAIVRALRRVFRHTFQCTADEGSTNHVVVALSPRAEPLTEAQDGPTAIAEAANDITSKTPFLTVESAKAAGALMVKQASPPISADVDVAEWAEELRPCFGEEDQVLLASLAEMSGAGVAPKKKKKNRRGGKKAPGAAAGGAQ